MYAEASFPNGSCWVVLSGVSTPMNRTFSRVPSVSVNHAVSPSTTRSTAAGMVRTPDASRSGGTRPAAQPVAVSSTASAKAFARDIEGMLTVGDDGNRGASPPSRRARP